MSIVKLEDCFFCFDNSIDAEDSPYHTILISERSYWTEHRAIDDCLSEVEGLDGWGNVMEGCFEYYGDTKESCEQSDVRAMLERAGASHCDEMSMWINEYELRSWSPENWGELKQPVTN